MTTFAGRVEAKMSVPTGGVSVSATIANGAGAQTATIASSTYYLTAAGGVSSLITTLQSALNTATISAPTTAATVATAIGRGTWTAGAGYLCQEASGSLASTFGSPATLSAGNTPTYRNTGYTTGDYAVGFDSSNDYFAGGTGDFNVTGTDDLAVAWVGKFTGTPSVGGEFLFVKGNSGTARWGIYAVSTALSFEVVNSAATYTSAVNISTIIGEWHVGIACIDRGTGQMRISLKGLTSGTVVTGGSTTITANTSSNADAFTVGARNASLSAQNWRLSAFYIVKGSSVASGMAANIATDIATFAAAINAAWTVTLDTTSTTPGRVSINWSGYATPTWSLSWTSTDLRDLLGFTANISAVTTTQTGTEQAQSLWFPDCPLSIESDPDQAPRVTDLRTSMSPTGNVLGLVGNSMYRHRAVTYSHVPKDRTWESAVTYANASWETFCKDALLGLGHAWMTPASPIQIYYSKAGVQTAVGYTCNSSAGISGWQVLNLSSIEPKPAIAQYAGLFRIELGDIVSAG